MRYQRVIKFVMSQALGLWRIFHWPGMTPASREIAAREPFHTAQERNCCRLLARFILHNLVLGEAAIEYSQAYRSIAHINKTFLRERIHRLLRPFPDIRRSRRGNRSRTNLEGALDRKSVV